MESTKVSAAEEPLLPRTSAMGPPKAGEPSVYVLGMVSAVLYGVWAVAMVFINKLTMQMFPLTNVVMLLQMVATWGILQPLQEAGVLTFPRFSFAKARQLFLITVLYTVNTAFALVGLKTLNVPMYNVLKRLTPMLVLVVKSLIRQRWPPSTITASVVMVVAGCIIAGIGDLTFDVAGYAFALLSCLAQGGYLLLVEFQGAGGISSSELLYYNAVCSAPLLALIVWLTGEGADLPAAYAQGVTEHGAPALIATVATCALAGVGLNYALFLCTTSNSALTTTIVGVLKGVVCTLLGFFLLGGVPFSAVNVAGVVLNTAGGVWYTWLKFSSRGGREDEGSSSSHGSSGGSSSGGDLNSNSNLKLPISSLHPHTSYHELGATGGEEGGAAVAVAGGSTSALSTVRGRR